ncbi:SusC/RagA family TonB-linked outer membrane protein [Cellulophaga sp. 20_2_10]|uniref:SusC/RagA family TonB-linked outer membrane protein n=1 Tax=Cellulophaga sp. 20_2_10 TaxID=2942476 RepID=UPI00201B1B88|nr:SusC/RagA family TonB-linked outer membrane protein [Cellulophaga sp. 20_2_10]MCL5246889.1 SusC/RagA family TonB-linked outer membrane protein [Cellulophaga sp. 20_2_10]
MRTKVAWILTPLLVLLMSFSYGQEKTITGNVTDHEGLPLPGVSVLVVGTTTGTQSDFDGNYTIKASVGQVLRYSYVGQKTTDRKVGSANTVSLQMEEDAEALDEVVVVGYSTSTKQAFTGTAKVIKADILEAKSFSNVSQALTGEVAGVNVINTSGQPGTVATIRIRGFGSVNGNRDPLYVVDGVPFSGSINSINPSDIASTTVLKDATATAIYGARGANGVILLTTKMGKRGSTSIEVDVKTGVNFQAIPRYDVINSADEYTELAWMAMGNRTLSFDPTNDNVAYANAFLYSSRGINPNFNQYDTNDVSQIIDPATGKVRAGVGRRYTPENWEDAAFQSSVRTEANLKMSGGNDKTRYFSSFGYLDEEGYIKNSNYKRYSTRLNVVHNPKEWLTATANLGYTYDETRSNGQSEDSGSVFWFVDNIPSIYPLYLRDAAGNTIPDTKYGGNQYDYGSGRGFGGLTNAIADSEYNLDSNKRHSVNASFSLKFDITKNLTYETKYGLQYYTRTRNAINNPFYGSAAGQDGSIYKQFDDALTQNMLNMFRYSKSFGSHTIEAIAAHETNKRDYEITSINKSGIVNLQNGSDQLNNYVVSTSPPGGYNLRRSLESYFAQVNYNFDNKYYLTGSIRRDGSSRFANDKWGTFGSVGASWVINQEDFMSNVDFIDFLKLKASYGLVGDEAGAAHYSGQNAYDIQNLGGEIALSIRAIQYEQLTWETSKMFQTGLEFTAFNNVLEGAVDYYVKTTDDLVFDKRLAPSTSNGLITVNDGTLENKGLEFDLTAHIIKSKDYALNFSINGEILDNKLTKMPTELATGDAKILDISGNYGRSKGHSLYDFYLREWAGVDTDNGNPLWNLYYNDANNNGAVDAGESIASLTEYKIANPNAVVSKTTTSEYADATQKYVNKSVIPTIRGAFRLAGRVKNFDISTQFAYSLGGYAYDGAYAGLMSNDQIGSGNYHVDIRDSWKQPGDVTDVPKLISNVNTQVNSASSRFIRSTDYFALNNVRLGYTLPSKFLEKSGLSGVNLWVSGDNLFLLSSKKGFNPMSSETGVSSVYRYAPLSTVTAGIRLKF